MLTDTRRLSALLAASVITACAPSTDNGSSRSTSCGLSQQQIGQSALIPAGSFIKGAMPLYYEESPPERLSVDGFRIQIHEVTNAQFEAFVAATGYVTDAEASVADGKIGAGTSVFLHPEERNMVDSVWVLSAEANWRQPEGAGSSLAGRMTEPVVHVSQRDAAAYAQWVGGRLPSEAEWEYAASIGLPDLKNPASGAYDEDGPVANIWQGIFPLIDLGTDGFQGASPVGCFPADKSGLFDMIGNVWEWTDTPYGDGTHTLKGGSYLCADNYCRRYRPAARQPQDSDFSSNHIGFRVVWDTETSGD